MWEECEVEHEGSESKQPSETVPLIWDGDGIQDAFAVCLCYENCLFLTIVSISFSPNFVGSCKENSTSYMV